MERVSEKPNPKYSLPLLPLRGALLFPGMVVPLNVGRPRSVSAIERAMAADRRIVLAHRAVSLCAAAAIRGRTTSTRSGPSP